MWLNSRLNWRVSFGDLKTSWADGCNAKNRTIKAVAAFADAPHTAHDVKSPWAIATGQLDFFSGRVVLLAI